MPCWYYDHSDLQSSPHDIIHQKQGVALIILISDILKIRYDVYETAVVYFHRTYISYSYSELHRHVVSLTCLNIACKYLDANIKLEDIIKSAKTILTGIQYEALGTDIQVEITFTEKLVLCALKFDLEIDHAYPYVTKMSKLIKGDAATIEKLVYMTWTFINDSLYSSLSVQYEPEVLAVSLFYLACRLAHFEFSEWEGMPKIITKKWYELFVPGVNIKVIQDICYNVLELYKKHDDFVEDDNLDNHNVKNVLRDERLTAKMAKSNADISRYASSFSSNSRSDQSCEVDTRRRDSNERKTRRHKLRNSYKYCNEDTTSRKKIMFMEKDRPMASTERVKSIHDANKSDMLSASRPLSENSKLSLLSLVNRGNNFLIRRQMNKVFPIFNTNLQFINPYPH